MMWIAPCIIWEKGTGDGQFSNSYCGLLPHNVATIGETVGIITNEALYFGNIKSKSTMGKWNMIR